MKKLLRLVSILLVLGLGFLYIVKNPELPISQNILTVLWIDMTTDSKQKAIDPNCISYFDGCNTCMVSGGIIGGCTKMFCQEPAEPQCLEYIRTGMDLSWCISYFDGCNNCSVKDGKPDACTEMYCETPTEPKCNEYTSELTGNSEMSGNEINENNIDAFFQNYWEVIDVEFRNALIDQQLGFIVIPNHDSVSVNPKWVIDIDGWYRFSITEKGTVCAILQTLNRSDLSCYDEANWAQIYIEFKKIDETNFQLWIAHYLGMIKTDLIKKTYPISAK